MIIIKIKKSVYDLTDSCMYNKFKKCLYKYIRHFNIPFKKHQALVFTTYCTQINIRHDGRNSSKTRSAFMKGEVDALCNCMGNY